MEYQSIKSGDRLINLMGGTIFAFFPPRAQLKLCTLVLTQRRRGAETQRKMKQDGESLPVANKFFPTKISNPLCDLASLHLCVHMSLPHSAAWQRAIENFWHPLRGADFYYLVSGGIAALDPPANIWQPFWLLRRRASINGTILELFALLRVADPRSVGER